MATLHMINAAPGASDAVRRCIDATSAGDAVVFYETGVLSAVSLPAESRPAGIRMFVHRRDADALHVTALIDGAFDLIDDAQLVALVVAYERSVSWL